jgi:hypothetical protein
MSGVSKMESDRRALLAAGRQALFVAALLFSIASVVAGGWLVSEAWVWQKMPDAQLLGPYDATKLVGLRGVIFIAIITGTLCVCLGLSAMVDWVRRVPDDIWLARIIRRVNAGAAFSRKDLYDSVKFSGCILGVILIFDDFPYSSSLSWTKLSVGILLIMINIALLSRYDQGFIYTLDIIKAAWKPQRSEPLASSHSRLGAFLLSLPNISFPAIAQYGRTTPRQAALIDASRCWGVIAMAWLAAEQFVPVWNYEAFPSDNRAYVWYAAFAVMGVAFGAYLYFSRKAKGPFDYKLLGRAGIQLAIGAGLVIVSGLAGLWAENTVGLIAIWLMVTASARIITLPWLPSLGQVFRRR